MVSKMVTLKSVDSWGRLEASILKCTAGCTFMETRYLSGGHQSFQQPNFGRHLASSSFCQLRPPRMCAIAFQEAESQPNRRSWLAAVRTAERSKQANVRFLTPAVATYVFCLLLYAFSSQLSVWLLVNSAVSELGNRTDWQFYSVLNQNF